MAEPLINRILYNEIPVRNLTESIRWYQEYLGFSLVWQMPEDGQAQLGLPDGPLLFLVEAPAGAYAHFRRGEGDYAIVGFHAPDIDRLYRHLQARDVPVEPAIRDDGAGNRFFWFYDLNGNRFEVQGDAAPAEATSA